MNRDFLHNFGRLPWTWLNLALTLAAGITQGLGIALFVPLLGVMEGATENLPGVFVALRDGLAVIGLPFTLPVLLVLITLLILTGFALTLAQTCVLMAYSWVKFVRDTRSELVDSLLRANWHHISSQASGTTVNNMMVEVTRTGRALTHQIMAIACVIQVVVFLALGMTLSWQLLVLAILGGIAAILAVRPLQRRAVSLGEKLTDANNALALRAVDYLTNLKLVKATATEPQAISRIDDLQNSLSSVISARQVNFSATTFVSQIFPVVLVAAVIYMAHDFLDVDTAITMVFLLFLARAAPLLAQAQQAYQGYAMDLPAVREVDAVIAENRANTEQIGGGKSKFSRIARGIVFEDVCYSFPNSKKPALENINLKIHRSRMVALVGPSGTGKSTMVDLLCGLRKPDRGRITVDGEDLNGFDINSWRRHIGYVTQDTIVFNESLKNNVGFANPKATEKDIERALEIAQLRAVVDDMPDGLDTQLGEGGVRLSGGQKQRLALARALVGNPQLLLLDEATSALDSESERAVQRAIESIAHRFTILVVAHRLSTVRKADMICVLDQGRIVETGTYDELLAMGGRFATMHDLQLH